MNSEGKAKRRRALNLMTVLNLVTKNSSRYDRCGVVNGHLK